MILMAMTTYPLNNILYQAEDAELFHCTRTSGVYDNLDFQYSVTGADNNVTIGKGLAWIRNAEFAGKVSANKQPIVLDLGLTAKVFPRIDAIVIQFDANKNATSIIVKKGEEASEPQPPKVVRTEAIYELHLYHVLRNPSDATITEGVITDLRTNYDYCGIMLDDISRIDQTLTKDGFAADSGVVGRILANKIQIDLLWTNPRPSSDFAGQDIMIDFSKYRFGIIVSPPETIVLEKNMSSPIMAFDAMGANKHVAIFSRQLRIKEDRVTFADCFEHYTNEERFFIVNGGCIPLRIYGVK